MLLYAGAAALHILFSKIFYSFDTLIEYLKKANRPKGRDSKARGLRQNAKAARLPVFHLHIDIIFQFIIEMR